MSSYSKVRGLFLMGSLFVALGTQAYGQGTQSTVLGTVTDSSGALVPGATVTVKNQGTGIERSLTTNESGDYRIAGLEAGNAIIPADRKSTRLNSSHSQISYAVFCLKKKKKKIVKVQIDANSNDSLDRF